MENKKISRKDILEAREHLRKFLKRYEGKEYIKLDIDPSELHQILFEKKIDYNELAFALVSGNDMKKAKRSATYYELAMELELVKKLDLSEVSFNKVNIAGLDLSGSKGISIKPRSVYKRNLSYTKLTDTEIIGSLDDCRIVGAIFEGSKGATINPQEVHSRDLSNAVLIDVTFTGYLNDCNIHGTVFSDDINVASLYNRKKSDLIKKLDKSFTAANNQN